MFWSRQPKPSLYASEDVLTLMVLGREALDNGRWQEASQIFGAAVQREPERAEAHHLRGMAFTMGGKYREALPHLDRAVALAPDDFEPFITRGGTRDSMG